MLFERATFLVISNAVRKTHTDVHRFEKVRDLDQISTTPPNPTSHRKDQVLAGRTNQLKYIFVYILFCSYIYIYIYIL